MWTARPVRHPRRDDRVCPECGERGSRVAHHPSGMVVLCRSCGHVHLALRTLTSPEPLPDDDPGGYEPEPDGTVPLRWVR